MAIRPENRRDFKEYTRGIDEKSGKISEKCFEEFGLKTNPT